MTRRGGPTSLLVCVTAGHMITDFAFHSLNVSFNMRKQSGICNGQEALPPIWLFRGKTHGLRLAKRSPAQLWLMPSRKSNGELILLMTPYGAHPPPPDGAGWTSSTWRANKYRRNIYSPQETLDFQTQVAQPSEVKSGNRRENGR